MTTIGNIRHLSVTETAKIVRKELKREFPGVKFSVRSKSYAGGASIDVSWTDGPIGRDVQPLLHRFEGSHFDGMIDLKSTRYHWLRPDGSVMLMESRGQDVDNTDLEPVIPDDAEPVHFGADFIFGTRRITDYEARQHEAEDLLYERYHIVMAAEGLPQPMFDMAGNNSVSVAAGQIVRLWREGETIPDAYERWLNRY